MHSAYKGKLKNLESLFEFYDDSLGVVLSFLKLPLELHEKLEQ